MKTKIFIIKKLQNTKHFQFKFNFKFYNFNTIKYAISVKSPGQLYEYSLNSSGQLSQIKKDNYVNFNRKIA
jgi:hypothetical protein